MGIRSLIIFISAYLFYILKKQNYLECEASENDYNIDALNEGF